MANLYSLPDEMIEHIFSFLRLNDRKSVRLVSKRLNHLSYSLHLIRKDVTRIDDYAIIDQIITPNSRHINVCVHVYPGELTGKSFQYARATNFWEIQGELIKSLRFSLGSQQLMLLCDSFPYCPKLEELTVIVDHSYEEYNLPFVPCKIPLQLPNLFRVVVMGFLNFLVEFITPIMRNCSKLETCTFYCVDIYGNKVDGELFFYGNRKLSLTLTAGPLLKNGLDDNFIYSLGEIIDNQCMRLTLNGGRFLTDSSLWYVASKASNLTELFLNDCSFSSDGLEKTFRYLPNLSVVSFINSSVHADLMEGLRNLTILNLSYCNGVADSHLISIFSSVRQKMRHTRLVGLNITDESIIKILPFLPNLEALHLIGLQLITNASLAAISNNNQNLRCLSYENNHFEQDFDFTGPSMNFLSERINFHFSKASCILKSFQCLNVELPQSNTTVSLVLSVSEEEFYENLTNLMLLKDKILRSQANPVSNSNEKFFYDCDYSLFGPCIESPLAFNEAYFYVINFD